MALIEWDDTWVCGIDIIDLQHMNLVAVINELYDSVSQGENDAHVTEALQKLKEYTQYHFTEEQGIMSTYGYPDYDGHRRAHVQFEQEIEELDLDRLLGDEDVSIRALTFLKQWLFQHIKGVDMKLCAFLKEKGMD